MLRAVKEEDRGKLITVSYSKLSLKDQCDYRYFQKYVKGNYSVKGSIATDIGSILHKGLELKGRYKLQREDVNYDEIIDTVLQGCEEKTDKGSEKLIGIDEIKKKYFEEWGSSDNASGMNYNEKMDVYFHDVLPTRMEDNDWKILGTEIKFEFVYDEKCIIHGFIDRIDAKYEKEKIIALRVVDYKSSKKVFRDTDIKTPLQMVVYDLACLFMYGILPEYHEYDFVLLDQKQTTADGVCSKGYMKRCIKKLDKILNSIIQCEKQSLYAPNPTPLCYWCEFADRSHTPNADSKFAGFCQYYSLWKPDQKNFKVNKEFIPGEPEKPKRKIMI